MANMNPNLYPQSNMEQWNFRSWHVGIDAGGKNTNPITPENVFLGAGPARLSDASENFASKVIPLGMIESASVNQQKMLQQVREIGSRRSYIIASYATGNIALSKVMYSQASLLRLLTINNDDSENLDNPAGLPSGTKTGEPAVDSADPVFYANLQAEIFDRPIGLLIYMLDQRNNPYGAMYAEDCVIQNHSFGLVSQGISISEQVNLMFDRLNPVIVSV